jgi:CheY-like chemotaxis protein
MPILARLPHILLAEDDLTDAELTERAFQEAEIPAIFTHVTDGVQAIARLESMIAGLMPLPNLIILDLNMPRTDGSEVFRFLREHSRLDGIPVVIFTGTRIAEQWQRCRELRPDAWVVKPDSFRELIERVREWRALMPDDLGSALDTERRGE